MNKRQKKKRYKKLYGHNPPKQYKTGNIPVTGYDLERIAAAMQEFSSRIQYAFGAALEGLGEALIKAGQAMQESTLEQRGEQNEQSNFNRAIDERPGNQNVSGWKVGGQIYSCRE